MMARFLEGSWGSGWPLSFFTFRLNIRILLLSLSFFIMLLTLSILYNTDTVLNVEQLLFGSNDQEGGHHGRPHNPPLPSPLPSSSTGEEDWIGSLSEPANSGISDTMYTANQRVIGLVFFGRRELVQILDCYLKRNLKDNGGALDEVVFTVHTDNESDLKYLDELVATSKSYRKHVPSRNYEWWVGGWEAVTEPTAIYVKIDDDVIFIEDSAVPAIVNRLLDNPQYFAVSANVVNNPALAWVHYSMGLYKPFWPELEKPSEVSSSWKPSELPSYQGPADGTYGFRNGSQPAPFQGHRWLPVRHKSGEKPYDMALSPASTLTYDAFGPSLHNWAAGAQTHYSFLAHLEHEEVSRYHFDIWDYAYKRLSINVLAVRGEDIIDAFPFPIPDDEDYLTVIRPKELGRHVVVDGTGVAVHFAFKPQYAVHDGRGLAWTDALARYGKYAREHICT